MEILKLAAASVICAVLCLVLKQKNEEYALIASLCASVLVIGAALKYLSVIYESVMVFTERLNIESSYVKILLKVIGVSYVAAFCSDICRDAGQSALAGKLDFAARSVILYLALPVVMGLFDLILGMI